MTTRTTADPLTARAAAVAQEPHRAHIEATLARWRREEAERKAGQRKTRRTEIVEEV